MIRSAAFLHMKNVANSSLHGRAASHFSFGDDVVDAHLKGGIARNALHEFYASMSDDASCAAAFAVMVAIRACQSDEPIIWITEDKGARINGNLYGPGLVELGLDPGRLLLINAADTLSVLRAAADIVKCGAIGCVIIEPSGPAPCFNMTASRRLALSAASSGVLTLVVRTAAEPIPSAAQSRWRIASSPSQPLEGNTPGHATFDISLLRHRGGVEPFGMQVQWNRDEGRFLSRNSTIASVQGYSRWDTERPNLAA